MKRKGLVLLMVWVLVVCSVSFAASLKVAPGAFCVKYVDVGKDLDLGMDLLIVNDSAEERSYSVTPVKPGQAKRKWLKGYSEIPDASWFYFLKDIVKVPPYSTGKLRMHLNIPSAESYYNQHWMVYVRVSNLLKKGQTMGVTVKPNYMIETQPRRNVKKKPYGILGLAPSVVKVKNVKPGQNNKTAFRIYNNDTVEHSYKISAYIPEASAERQDISATAGYEWVEKTDWVKPLTRQVELKPGEAKKVVLEVSVPEDSETEADGWEAIVFVEPDYGLAGFVRVLVEPEIIKKDI